MGRCRKCGQNAGNNRRTCKLCSLEDRHAGAESRRTPLETHDGRSVGSWIRVDGTWHASVAFDGYVHEFACGHEFDDFPAEKAVIHHHCVDVDAICDGCRKEIAPESVPPIWEDDERFVSAAEIRTDGGVDEAYLGDEGPHKCDVCEIVFKKVGGLANHVCIPVDEEDDWQAMPATTAFAGPIELPSARGEDR